MKRLAGLTGGLLLLGVVSACGIWKSDDPVDATADVSTRDVETKPQPLRPGEERCSEQMTGRVCVGGPGDDLDAGSPYDFSLPDGGLLLADGGVVAVGCTVIRGIVRDFRRGDKPDGHPDFETKMGSGEKGIVEPKLDARGRPRLAEGEFDSIYSEESFSQWYRDVEGVNQTFEVTLELSKEDGYQVFGTTTFFPLDDLGYGDEGLGRNFGFTTELHAYFLYDGEGSFQLAGDDDLWLFINGQLVIDLGGVHGWQSSTINVADVAESAGLELGKVYTLDIFHAERHSTESKFYAKTNLFLAGCTRRR
jgi:fibro-slime domain-containing protein